MSALEKLKRYTKVVINTENFEIIDKFKPKDATSNPSLILAASKRHPTYKRIIDKVQAYLLSTWQHSGTLGEATEKAVDKMLVLFGVEILKIIPGRVSTEVDTRLSFNKEAQIRKAKSLIAMYEEKGIPKERVLINLPSTWEGIQAAKE